MYELITIVVFLAYLVRLEWVHSNHVKDLENKLMAKTPDEYLRLKRADTPIKPQPITDESDDYIDPLDADPNDALKGITRE